MEAPEAALIAALAQEWDRRLHLELARLLGDPLIRFAEDVLCRQRDSAPVCLKRKRASAIPRSVSGKLDLGIEDERMCAYAVTRRTSRGE